MEDLKNEWLSLTNDMSLLYSTMRKSKKRMRMIEELNKKRIINIQKQKSLLCI